MRSAVLLVGVLACDPATTSPASPPAPVVTKVETTNPTATTAPTDPPAPAQPRPSAAVTKIVGPATADVLLRATERATFRVDAKRHDGKPGPDRFGGYPITATGRALSDAEARTLAELLLADASWSAVDKYACPNDEAFGLRATHAGEVVELLFVFPCDRVVFLRRASGDPALTPGEYLDPVGARVLALLRAAAP